MACVDIPPCWERSVENILKNQWRKVLVMGASDRGKSTYCHFLIGRLYAAGFKTAFVDADIGQKDMGPPTMISLGYPKPPLALSETRIAGLYFVGAISPIGHLLPMVIGTQRLVDSARAAFVVINTTGLIHGSGLILKGFQIEAIQPDIIVAIERDQELGTLLRGYRHNNIIRIMTSSQARAKCIQHRKANRERAFYVYFKDARHITLNIRKMAFPRSRLFNGEPLHDSRFIYCERTSEGLLAVCATPAEETTELRLIPADFEQNLLCGLADCVNHGLGLGIIKKIDFTHMTFSVLTPVFAAKRIKNIQWGNLYLDSDGRELGKCAFSI